MPLLVKKKLGFQGQKKWPQKFHIKCRNPGPPPPYLGNIPKNTIFSSSSLRWRTKINKPVLLDHFSSCKMKCHLGKQFSSSCHSATQGYSIINNSVKVVPRSTEALRGLGLGGLEWRLTEPSVFLSPQSDGH